MTTVYARLALIVCVVIIGCRGASPPVEPSPLAVAVPSDANVLLGLDYYEPVYKVDADGRVVRLRLPARHLSASVLAEIGKLTELQYLDLYGADITDDGLAELKDLKKLRNFGLGNTPITDKGLLHLHKLEGLQYVWLSKKHISEEAAQNLRAALPSLRQVYLQ